MSNDKAASSGKSLSETELAKMINSVWEQADTPIKILTPKDFLRGKVGVLWGVPIFVDPLIPKDTVLVEYASGHREPLSIYGKAALERLK